jgi:hypothetical protein
MRIRGRLRDYGHACRRGRADCRQPRNDRLEPARGHATGKNRCLGSASVVDLAACPCPRKRFVLKNQIYNGGVLACVSVET